MSEDEGVTPKDCEGQETPDETYVGPHESDED